MTKNASKKTSNATLTALKKMKEKQAKLAEKIQRIEDERKQEEDARETQKKIIIGGYYLDKAKRTNAIDKLIDALDKHLTRKSDRALFDLPPLPKAPLAGAAAKNAPDPKDLRHSVTQGAYTPENQAHNVPADETA